MVQLNLDGQLLRAAITKELERQHEQSGIHDLVVSRTEEVGELRVEGKLNIDELALAIMKHGVGKAYKAIVGYDPFEDDPSQTLEEVTQLLGEVIVEHQRAAEGQSDGS